MKNEEVRRRVVEKMHEIGRNYDELMDLLRRLYRDRDLVAWILRAAHEEMNITAIRIVKLYTCTHLDHRGFFLGDPAVARSIARYDTDTKAGMDALYRSNQRIIKRVGIFNRRIQRQLDTEPLMFLPLWAKNWPKVAGLVNRLPSGVGVGSGMAAVAAMFNAAMAKIINTDKLAERVAKVAAGLPREIITAADALEIFGLEI